MTDRDSIDSVVNVILSDISSLFVQKLYVVVIMSSINRFVFL